MKRLLLLPLLVLHLGACNLLQIKPQPDPFYRVVLAQSPKNKAALFAQGERYMTQGQYGAALPCFDRLTRLEPANAEAWFNLGRCQYEQRHFGKSRAAFGKALQLRASEAVILGLAAATLMDGDLAEARRLTQESEQKFGVSAALLQVQGDVAYLAGDWAGALAFYRQSLEKNPTQPEIKSRTKDLEDFLTSAG